MDMNGTKKLTAEFLVGRKLTVVTSGNAAGTVTSSPAGIACGATCSALFADGDPVTLTAHPGPHSLFAGWSPSVGECPSYDACTLFMDGNRGVVAHFIPRPPGAGSRPKTLQTKVTKTTVDHKHGRAVFKFVGSGGLGKRSFQCQIDKGKFQRCSSPKRYAHLKAGRHTFRVRTRDAKGRYDTSPATVKFKV
jgi:hypothetical protein